MKISGHIVDVRNRKIFDGIIHFQEKRILSIEECNEVNDQYILPGFVDAHVHVESSMLVPSEFARLAVVHGMVSTVSDPHEIGNVMGVEGVEYMIDNASQVNFKFNFGAPSCVPATHFETAGAEITTEEIDYLMSKKEVKYLAEMMNWPGVLQRDSSVLNKIEVAKKYNKPVDGHAPGLKGEDAQNYIAAGISTDHECFTAEEARDKLKHNMKIAIREGSAAKNFEALVELFYERPEMLMFCSDDKHPDNLVQGHINELVKRALAKGHDLMDVLTAASINPIDHYKLEVGTLQVNDPADFIVVKDLEDFEVLQTFINGEKVAEKGKSLIEPVENKIINQFNCKKIEPKAIQIKAASDKIHVIEALDGQLITNDLIEDCLIDQNGFAISNTENDILKMVVVNRYEDAPPAVAFIKNFGIQQGAIASSVGHDSHNILAVGVDDESITKAINLIIGAKGGVSAVDGEQERILPLPAAGIMSAEDGYQVAEEYTTIDRMAKNMGSKLVSPFMTLSFMALLVIPELKLSDKGLFDGKNFQFKKLFISTE